MTCAMRGYQSLALMSRRLIGSVCRAVMLQLDSVGVAERVRNCSWRGGRDVQARHVVWDGDSIRGVAQGRWADQRPALRRLFLWCYVWRTGG